MDSPLFIDPQPDDLQPLQFLGQKLHRLLDVHQLILVGGGVARTAVVANDGNADRCVVLDGDTDTLENRLDGVGVVLFTEDQVWTRLRHRIDMVDTKSLLEIADDWQLSASIDAIDDGTESHFNSSGGIESPATATLLE